MELESFGVKRLVFTPDLEDCDSEAVPTDPAASDVDDSDLDEDDIVNVLGITESEVSVIRIWASFIAEIDTWLNKINVQNKMGIFLQWSKYLKAINSDQDTNLEGVLLLLLLRLYKISENYAIFLFLLSSSRWISYCIVPYPPVVEGGTRLGGGTKSMAADVRLSGNPCHKSSSLITDDPTIVLPSSL